MMAVELLRMIDDGRLESQFLPAATALLAALLHNCDQARVLFFVSAFFAHIPPPHSVVVQQHHAPPPPFCSQYSMLAQVRHFVSYSSSLLAKTIESSGGDPVLLVSVLEAGDAADAMAALAERCSGEPTFCQWRAACGQMGSLLGSSSSLHHDRMAHTLPPPFPHHVGSLTQSLR